MNYRSNKKRKIIFIVMLAVALTATIGYAVLNTVLKNNITATIAPVNWQVYMDNVLIHKDTTLNIATNTVSLSNVADACIEYSATNSTICTKSTTLDANVKFDRIEEYVMVKFNVTNGGDIPVIIAPDGITVEGLGDFVTYSLKYTNTDTGRDVSPGDYIGIGASKTMYLKLKYSIPDNASEENLPTEEQSFNIRINIKYVKGSIDDGAGEPVDAPVINTAAQAIISNSLIGSSSEITSYTTAMTASYPSKLYLLESTKDDQNPIYFWRGTRAATKNNFIFANMCWLGIRTTDTGGIKIIYNGVPVDGKCTTTGESTMIGIGAYDSTDPYTVEYKDGETDSDVKKAVEEWYKTNILTTYDSYLEDTVYCNDLGSFYYSRQNGAPSLACSTEDSYTVGNGKLKYKVGLISADEAMFSGVNANTSTEPFLNANYIYYTMTQGDAAVMMFYVASGGVLNVTGGYVYGEAGFRPVVSLNAAVRTTGTGTQDDPFVVSME